VAALRSTFIIPLIRTSSAIAIMANYLDDASITAQEIMALDDEQLDQYLKDNHR
jgi:hypothetical protein